MSEDLSHNVYHVSRKLETRRFCQKALLECMNRRKFSEISISELVRTAQIGRRTFYRHFNCLQDVLDSCFEDLSQCYLQQVPNMDHFSLRQACRDFFAFWSRHKELLTSVYRSCGPGKISACILRQAPAVIGNRSKKSVEFIPVFTTGGFCALLEQWAANDCSQDVMASCSRLLEEWDMFLESGEVKDMRSVIKSEKRSDDEKFSEKAG